MSSKKTVSTMMGRSSTLSTIMGGTSTASAMLMGGMMGDTSTGTVGTSSGFICIGGRHIHHNTPTEVQAPSNPRSRPFETALLQHGLRQFYNLREEWYYPIKGLNCRPRALKDDYVEFQCREIHRNGFVPEGTIPIQEVLLDRGSSNPRPIRILVVGEAGYGKSTLCKKFVHDWVEESEYISQFKVVVHIRLRGVTSTIEDAVVQLCNKSIGSNHEKGEILQYLNQLGSKCLLILDGYDELKESAKPSLESIFEYGNSGGESFLKLATVLMTSRPENKSDEDEKDLWRKPVVGLKIRSNVAYSFQRFVKIEKLSDEARISFIEKYFQNDSEKATKLVAIIRMKEMRLTRSPLLLHIMCYIHENGTDINAHEEFWEQYLKLIFTREMSRDDEGLANLNEKVFDSIVLQLGEIFFKHLKQNDLYIEEQEIQEVFLENTALVVSCGLLQKAFSFRSDDSEKFETSPKTLMEYLSGKFLNNALAEAEKNGDEWHFVRELFDNDNVNCLICTISTTSLSVEFQSDLLLVQFIVEDVERTSRQFFRVKGRSVFRASHHDDSDYHLSLLYMDKEAVISEVVNYLSTIYPICDGIHRLKYLVQLLDIDVLPQKFCRLKFYISSDHFAVFCEATKLSKASLRMARVECTHSLPCSDNVDEQPECYVEEICSVLLSKPRMDVLCTTHHSLREDQLTAFLLKEIEGENSSLVLSCRNNEIHREFLDAKYSEGKLEDVTLQKMDRLIFALRPAKNVSIHS